MRVEGARGKGRSIVNNVERALEAHEARGDSREPASEFYARLTSECGTDIDMAAVIREARRSGAGRGLGSTAVRKNQRPRP